MATDITNHSARRGSPKKSPTKKMPKQQKATLPLGIGEALADIMAMLEPRADARNPENYLIRRVIKDVDRPLLISGFGLPDPYRPTQSRLLVLIEEIGRREEVVARQAKDLFHLTAREVAVVEHLLKGWTNKEIAFVLKLTEQTVKEHIQRIM